MKKARNSEKRGIYSTPVLNKRNTNTFALFQSPVHYTPSKDVDDSDIDAIYARIKELESQQEEVVSIVTPVKPSVIKMESPPSSPRVKYVPTAIRWNTHEEERENSFLVPCREPFFVTPSKLFDPVKLGRSTAISGNTCHSSQARWIRVDEAESDRDEEVQQLHDKVSKLQAQLSALEAKISSGTFSQASTTTQTAPPSMASIMANRPPNPFAAAMSARPGIDLSFGKPQKSAAERTQPEPKTQQQPAAKAGGPLCLSLSDITGVKLKKMVREEKAKPPPQGGVGFGGLVSLDVLKNTKLRSAADRKLKSPPKETRARVIGNQFLPTLGEITGLKLRASNTDILRSPGGTPFRKIASPQKFSSPRSMLRAKLTPVSTKTPTKPGVAETNTNNSASNKKLFLNTSIPEANETHIQSTSTPPKALLPEPQEHRNSTDNQVSQLLDAEEFTFG